MTNIASLLAAQAAVLALLAGCTSPAEIADQQRVIPTRLPIAQEGPCCGPVTEKAKRFIAAVDSMDVEHNWRRDWEVEWTTGTAIAPMVSGSRGRLAETHCSDFVAAVGHKFGVPIPNQNFKHVPLTATQIAYFDSHAGRRDGWIKVETAEQAQALANQGFVVVIETEPTTGAKSGVYSGHAAIVRPNATRTAAQIDAEGVIETQAGGHNWKAINALRGFKAHVGTDMSKLQYFAHALDEQLSAQSAS
jgi:hypothetical protein